MKEKDYSCSISIPQSSLAALRSCVTDRGNELRGRVGVCLPSSRTWGLEGLRGRSRALWAQWSFSRLERLNGAFLTAQLGPRTLLPGRCGFLLRRCWEKPAGNSRTDRELIEELTAQNSGQDVDHHANRYVHDGQSGRIGKAIRHALENSSRSGNLCRKVLGCKSNVKVIKKKKSHYKECIGNLFSTPSIGQQLHLFFCVLECLLF